MDGVDSGAAIEIWSELQGSIEFCTIELCPLSSVPVDRLAGGVAGAIRSTAHA